MSAHTDAAAVTQPATVPAETLRVQVRIEIDGCPPILVDEHVTLTYYPDPRASDARDDTRWLAEGGGGGRTMYQWAPTLAAWVSDRVNAAVNAALG